MNNLYLSIEDFVCYIMEGYLTDKTEIYQYVKSKTDNFDKVQSYLFQQDVKRYYNEFIEEKITEYENDHPNEMQFLKAWLYNNYHIRKLNDVLNLFEKERRKIANELNTSNKLFNISGEKERNSRNNKNQEEPSTERARKAFDLAIEKGFMEKTRNGYRWLYLLNEKGHKASLAYFLVETYNSNNSGGITPFKELSKLFGVKRIDSAADKVHLAKNAQWWRKKIDDLLSMI